MLSSSAAGLSSTFNDEEDYFRLGFTFFSHINTYLRVDHNIDLQTSFLKTRLLPDAESFLLFLSSAPTPLSPTSLPFLIAFCPFRHIVQRN
jgi:hypothetical protein